ncbi:hypothetical protein MTO96_003471 [Rhipicephalus appendiculatus]
MKKWTMFAIALFTYITESLGHPANGAEERAGSIVATISDLANNIMNTAVNLAANLFALGGIQTPPYTTAGQPLAVP